jgi:hypothetical protein
MSLAGTVAFPKPFPSAGAFSVEDGPLSHTTGARSTKFVVLQEKSRLEEETARSVLKEDVAAIFFPGVWEDTDQGHVFRFAEQDRVHDLEKGEWFLNPEIDAETISRQLNIDIRRRDSRARGIIFVPESRPVLTNHEFTQPAGSIEALQSGCDPRRC